MTVSILVGDVLARLSDMDSESVDCVVTSPPYWGLRDYGVDGQLGMEATLGEHLQKMVEVFDEVRRVMKPDATLWLNYGDCYATKPAGWSAKQYKDAGTDDRTFRDKPFSTVGPINPPGGADPFRRDAGRRGGGRNSDATLKEKDLCMIPNRLAISLQERGWWVRSEIIWAKPNPMPESVRDRPAGSHEKIWLLTKAPRYFYNAEAVRQQAAASSVSRWAQNVEAQTGSDRANGGAKTNGPMKAVGGARRANENANGFRGGSYVGGKPGHREQTGNIRGTGDRSLRNYEPAPVEVWVMATQPFKEAHFATFPPELAARCITAGCREGGLVLDPFGGAGTTGLVADRLGRNAILIELNAEYAEIARKRIETEQGMFANTTVHHGKDLTDG